MKNYPPKLIARMPFELEDGTRGCINNRIHLFKDVPFNLFSGNQLFAAGFKMTGDNKPIIYTKGNYQIVFDIKVKTPKCVLSAITHYQYAV